MRGVPVGFRWRGDPRTDSVAVTLEGGGATHTVTLRFDADGLAPVTLQPAVYAWCQRRGSS